MAHLSIRLLGPIRVELDGKPVTGFATDKTRALLAYLVVETDRPHSRETLAGLLWPDYPKGSARNSLRTALVNLRSVIGDREADPHFLHVTRHTVQFNTDSDTWCDVIALQRLVMIAPDTLHGEEWVRKLEDAVKLYQSGFLEGFSLTDSVAFEDWALIKREQLQRRVLKALQHLAAYHEHQGNNQSALQYARRQVELDPWQEDAQRQLMRLLACSDQRGAALAQYEALERLLGDELGVEPAAETRRLHTQIRDGELQAPAPHQAALSRYAGQPPSFLSATAPVAIEKTVFVAREQKLARLDTHLKRAMDGHGQVLFIIGDAGRGKTALMKAFTRRAQEAHPDLLVADGTCNAHSGLGDPYLPFRQVLGMLIGDVETLWAGGKVTTGRARRLWAILPHTAQLVMAEGPDLIGTIVAGSALVGRAALTVSSRTGWLTKLTRLVEVRATVPSSSELTQMDLFEQYSRVLRGVARQAPLVILLDDLQWGDQGSIGLLFHLGRQVLQSRILLLCAYRPEEVALGRDGGQHPLERVVSELRRVHGDVLIDLDQEAPGARRRFVEAFLDSEPNRLSTAFRETVYAYTDGHPLYTIELVRLLQERGDIVRDKQGFWLKVRELDCEELPPRVEAVIEKRVGRLQTDLREALSIASVEGEEFTAQVVARVQEIPERQVLRALAQELEKRHRLVREQSELPIGHRWLSRYRFTHNLFQRYLYNALGAGERRLLHAEVARALEEIFADDMEAVTVQLAFHYRHAEIQEKALHYLMQAGDQARARFASQEAVRYYSEALSLLPKEDMRRFDLFVARATSYAMMAARPAQREDVDAMLALAEASGEEVHRCDALIALADYYLATEPFLAQEPLAQANEIARGLGDPVREAHILRRMAWEGRLVADFETSRIYLEEAAARFREAGLPGEAAGCLLLLARALPGSGQQVAEFEAAEEALALSRQAGDLRQEAIALRHLAVACMNQGSPHEALPIVEQALALHRELGDRSEECRGLDVLGAVLAWLGRTGEAEAQFRQCVTLAEEISLSWEVLLGAIGLWNYWYAPRGEYEQALAFCDERLKKAVAVGHEWTIGAISWLKILALSELGRFEEALVQLQIGIEVAAKQGDLVSHALSLAEDGWLRISLRDFRRARQNLNTALELAKRTGDQYLVGWTLTYQAYLIQLAGEQAEWRDGLDKAYRAIVAFRDVNEVRQLARGMDVCARLHLSLGEPSEALVISNEVMHLFQTAPALPRPQEHLYTHARVLRALGRDAEAGEHLRQAYERVLFVAENISDEALRQSWLENVRVNREILREWEERTSEE